MARLALYKALRVARAMLELMASIAARLAVVDRYRSMLPARNDLVKFSGFPGDRPVTASAKIIERLKHATPNLSNGRGARHVDQIEAHAVRAVAIAEYFRYADGIKHDVRNVSACAPSSRSLRRLIAFERAADASKRSSPERNGAPLQGNVALQSNF